MAALAVSNDAKLMSYLDLDRKLNEILNSTGSIADSASTRKKLAIDSLFAVAGHLIALRSGAVSLFSVEFCSFLCLCAWLTLRNWLFQLPIY